MGMLNSHSLFIFLLIIFIPASLNGYFFKCLELCECDTDDEAILCHNTKNREKFELPQKRLRGFTVIGLTNNNLRNLPSEKSLLEKFPDLKAIDVELNINFNCSSLSHYSRISILSDCDKTEIEIAQLKKNFELIENSTLECDSSTCQSRNPYDSTYEYFKRLIKLIKEKLNALTEDSPFFAEIKKMIVKLKKKFQEIIKKDE